MPFPRKKKGLRRGGLKGGGGEEKSAKIERGFSWEGIISIHINQLPLHPPYQNWERSDTAPELARGKLALN